MKHSLRQIPTADLQARLPGLLAAQKPAARPASGWLRAVRQALGLAQADVAKKTGITKQAYAQFEQGETKGTLSLGSLQRAAEAMDCDFVYYLVPRTKSFGEPAPRNDPALAPPPANENPIAREDQPADNLPAHLL